MHINADCTLLRLRVAACALAALLLALHPRAGMAGIVFESATGPGEGGAVTAGPAQFPGSRFQTSQPYNITAVGAGFIFQSAPANIFLAITPINSVTSFPDPSLSGTIFHGLVDITNPGAADYALNTNFVLPAGSYAILAGSGLFGATGNAGINFGHTNTDAAGDFIINLSQPGRNEPDPNYGIRFFVEGIPTGGGGIVAVPLPSAFWPAVALLCVVVVGYWYSSRRVVLIVKCRRDL